MTSKCLTSSAEQEQQWYHQHRKPQLQTRWSSIRQEDQQQQQQQQQQPRRRRRGRRRRRRQRRHRHSRKRWQLHQHQEVDHNFHRKAIADTPMASAAPALASSPKATSPTSCHSRPTLPSPPKRHLADDIAEGSSTKQQRTPAQPEAPAPPEPTPEQPKSRFRITKVTPKTKQGEESQLTPVRMQQSNNWTNPSWTHGEQHRWTRQEENTWRNETGDSPHEAAAGLHGGGHQHTNTRTTQEHHPVTLGPTRQGQQGPSKNCRKRIYRNSNRLGWYLCANTHFLCVENAPHISMQQRMDWPNRSHLNMRQHQQRTPTCTRHKSSTHRMETTESNPRTKQQSTSMAETPCGSPSTDRTSPQHSRTQHLHDRSTRLLCFGLRRRPSLPWRGTDRQQALQGSPGNTVAFLGRNITNRGDHYEISLSNDYTTTLLTETNLQDSKPAPAPGTSALKTATADHEQALSAKEHAQYRRAVGKLQWMTYTTRHFFFFATRQKNQQTVSPAANCNKRAATHAFSAARVHQTYKFHYLQP